MTHDGIAFYVFRYSTTNEPQKYFLFPHKSISKFTKLVRFDVMLSKEGGEQTALNQAQGLLDKISEPSNPATLDSCRFCHIKEAKHVDREKEESDGYCIVPIENCPEPYMCPITQSFILVPKIRSRGF